ncbi:transcriptional activator srcap [Fusarium tjaetaba]|uniref:Transcriptional activator srcap n=1 Tax=Fusarium tjaetaba TaxID=1567544 RepID=A0A8H5QF03_9HYPO|nr:transcriptional activator srcap [Fusarium tjaetaba]KAF5614100.1 transcriptional activator srcap [Fusarium tjaetaba]
MGALNNAAGSPINCLSSVTEFWLPQISPAKPEAETWTNTPTRGIERDFECQDDPDKPEDRKGLVFDGLFITHRDKDHDRAVKWYLLQDMMRVSSRNFRTLSRGRYDKDDEPESYFHVPTWKDPTTWNKADEKNCLTSIVGKAKLGEPEDVMFQIKVEADKWHPKAEAFMMRVGTERLSGRDLLAKEDTAVSPNDRYGCESLEKLIEMAKPT